MVKVCSQTSTCGCVCPAAPATARMISLPVASPKAWAMRSRPWPPSRPRASWPSTSSNLVPQADQLADPLRAPRRPRARRLRGSHSEPPAVSVSATWSSQRSVGPDGAGDAALGVAAVGLPQPVLGDQQDRQLRIDGQRRPQPGQSPADDQHVGEEVRHALGMERHEVSRRGGQHGSVAGRIVGAGNPFIVSPPWPDSQQRLSGRRCRGRGYNCGPARPTRGAARCGGLHGARSSGPAHSCRPSSRVPCGRRPRLLMASSSVLCAAAPSGPCWPAARFISLPTPQEPLGVLAAPAQLVQQARFVLGHLVAEILQGQIGLLAGEFEVGIVAAGIFRGRRRAGRATSPAGRRSGDCRRPAPRLAVAAGLAAAAAPWPPASLSGAALSA